MKKKKKVFSLIIFCHLLTKEKFNKKYNFFHVILQMKKYALGSTQAREREKRG
jgi:hypothetical protein